MAAETSNERVVDIASNERVLLVGKTGSGKTWLAMHLLAPLPRVVVIDLKGSDTIARPEFSLEDDRDGRGPLWRLEQGENVRVRVRDRERSLAYMRAAMNSGNCVVYIDEVYSMVEPRANVPPEVTAIWTQGRELGVGGWAATQRPTLIPIFLITESEWRFVFRLSFDEDRKRVAGFTSEEVERKITDKHGFFVMREDWDAPRYYRRLSASLRVRGTTSVQA